MSDYPNRSMIVDKDVSLPIKRYDCQCRCLIANTDGKLQIKMSDRMSDYQSRYLIIDVQF